jgi:hypothetical protein
VLRDQGKKGAELIKNNEKTWVNNKDIIVTDCLRITIIKTNGTSKEVAALISPDEVQTFRCNKLTSKKV